MDLQQDQFINRNHFSFSRSSSRSLLDTPVPILQHLKCSVCIDLLNDPVTTACGHTFCKMCLNEHLNTNKQRCPLCKKHLITQPAVNITIRDILNDFHKAQKPNPDEFTGQEGEVACDICADDRKHKAVKSCLICLLSYCKKHLEKHNNKLREGHKLVAPLNELDQRACTVHGRPLELYSITEGKVICSLCVQGGMTVVSVEEEAQKRQAELGTVINESKQKIQQRYEKVQELERSATTCLSLIEQERKEITQVFSAIKKEVQKVEDELLRPLEERRKQVEQEAEMLKRDLQRNINTFSKRISDLQILRDEEDSVFFLQSHGSVLVEDNDNDRTYVSLNTDLSFGTMRSMEVTMMADIRQQFEKLSRVETARVKKYAVDVTLDQDTANAQLIISDDMKEVQSSVTKSDVPDCPERFDVFGSVLGQNQLTEGRSFWVIEVGNNNGWDIGVAREEANRKGAVSFKPSQGYWVIVHYNGEKYAALEDHPSLLSLSNKPSKIGVFVDYDESLVSFYDMNKETHIYSFTECAFGGVIRPYLSPHLNQNTPMVICPVHSTE